MLLSNLNLDRFGKKINATNPDTDEVVSSISNNKGYRDTFQQNSVDNGSKDTKNIPTGTVIVACIVKTSDGPSRVELAGNDAKFYDDSYSENGLVKGDTSTLSFLRSDDNTKGFVLQKRVGKDNDSDNILELFANTPATGRFNSIFIGRKGNEDTGNLGSLTISIDTETSKTKDLITSGGQNGNFSVTLSRDGVKPNVPAFAVYDARISLNDDTKNGQRAILIGTGDDGLAGLAYEIFTGGTWQVNQMLYTDGPTSLKLGATLVPDVNNSYDLGTSSARLRAVYGGDVHYTALTNDSDRSLKKDIMPLNYGLNTLCQLNPVQFRYIADDKTIHLGFIAQEVKEFLPELVSEDAGLKKLASTEIIAVLVKAVQELNAEVKNLRYQLLP